MMSMRTVRRDDEELLLAWRNDPSALSCFRSTAAISSAEHARWMRFAAQDGYPAHIVWIGENDGEPVGVVRFDQTSDVMKYRVSIVMAPEHRGKGFGRAILQSGCLAMKESTLIAEIRRGNKASRTIFADVGFEQVGHDGDFLRYERGPM